MVPARASPMVPAPVTTVRPPPAASARRAASRPTSTGFVSRGTAAVTATLLAEISVTVLYVALDEWLDQDGDRKLAEIVLDTLAGLRATLASVPAEPSVSG